MRSPTPPLEPAGPATVARLALAVTVLVLALTVSGCAGAGARTPSTGTTGTTGSTDTTVPPSLLAEARPIGRGRRFHPAVTGSVRGTCRRRLGRRYGAHVEVFAANRVVLLPAGIGLRGPTRRIDGRVTGARCYGALVTLDPTGLVLVRTGDRPTLAGLFAAWGELLSSKELAGFRSRPGNHVTAYVDGRAWMGLPGSIPLTRHVEIVLEVGPHVPPHHSYTFPPGF